MDSDNNTPTLDDDNDDQFTSADFAEDSDNQTTGITEPRDSDVMCGRGGAALRHAGNQTYRRLVNDNKALYITCLKTEKLKISRSIVAAIRAQNGRFLEKESTSDSDNKGKWYDIGDKKAVEKTSQALREGQPKLKEKMAQQQQLNHSAVGLNGISLSADINPHSLPYAAPNMNPQYQISLPPSAATSHAFGSMQSMGSSSFNMNDSSLLSNSGSIYSIPYANKAEILSVQNNDGSLGVQMPPSATPLFEQHHNGSKNGLAMMRLVSSYNQEQQEYQVQRMQAAENPHHRDIQLNNIMMPNACFTAVGANGEIPLQPELLQRLSLHDVSIASSSSPPQTMGTIDGGGYHLQPSNSALSGFCTSVRTVDSNAVNSIDTFNTLSDKSMINRLMKIENPQERLAVAGALGIGEVQLSLLSQHADVSVNGGNQGFMDLSRHTMDTQDSFKNAINNLPMNRTAGVSNAPNLDSINLNNGGLSHINVDYNTSLTSCVTNHSAFNTNGNNNMSNNIMAASLDRTQGSTSSASYQQYVLNQQHHQQQQRNQLFLQQRQLQQQRQQQSNNNYTLQASSFSNEGSNAISANGGFHYQDNHVSNRLLDVPDKRQQFATMKYIRPPSLREQDVPGLTIPNGQIRRQQQPIQRVQPEIAKTKLSDGISGGRPYRSVDGGNDDGMGDSNHSICSNFTLNTMDTMSPDEIIPSEKCVKKNEVIVETAKVRDHSSKYEQARKEEFANNHNGSKRSLMSGISEYTMFSDLSRKIGNVSTRSLAMSEMSSVDHIDLEGDVDDDDGNNLNEKDTHNLFNDEKEHLYEDVNDVGYRAAAKMTIQRNAQHPIAIGADESRFHA